MKRGIIRFIPWWAIALVLVLVTAWIFRVDIAQRGFNQWFNVLNIDNTEFVLKEIDTSKAWIDSAHFTLSTESQQFATDLTDIKASYAIENLYLGKINSISIEQAVVRVTAKKTPSTTDFKLDLDEQIETFISLLSLEIPVASLTIDRVIFQYSAGAESKYSPVSIQLESISASSSLKIEHEDWNALIHKTTSHLMGSIDTEAGLRILDIDTKIQTSKSEQPLLASTINLDSIPFSHWWHEPIGLENLGSALNLNFQLQPSKTEDALLTLTIATNEIKTADFEAAQLEISGATSLPNTLSQNSLESISYSNLLISLKEFQSTDFSTKDIKVSSDGEISYTDSELSIKTLPNTVIEVSELLTPQISITNTALSAALNYSSSSQSHTLEIQNGSRFKSNLFNYDPLVATNMDVDVMTPVHLQLSPSNDISWQVHSGKVKLNNANVKLDDLLVSSTSIDFDLKNITTTNATIQTKASQVELMFEDQPLSLQDIDIQSTKTQHQVKNTGSFSLAGIPVPMQFNSATNILEIGTEFDLHTQAPLDLFIYEVELKQLIDLPILEPLGLHSGEAEISINGKWNSNDGIVIDASPNFRNISGIYKEIAFQDGSIEGLLAYPFSATSDRHSAHINVGQIESGVNVKNVDFDMRLMNNAKNTGTEFEITNLRGNILGTQISSDKFIFDSELDTNLIGLRVEGLDLEKVIELQEIEGLKVTGKLDGFLPIKIVENGVRIAEGKLQNQETGGNISYNVDDSLKQSLSNPLTDSALKALSNFDFDILTADVDYEPTGELLINFHIEGTSPHLENNQPVHLNLNTEQNVLSLLESLKYTNNLNEEVDKNIRKSLPSSN